MSVDLNRLSPAEKRALLVRLMREEAAAAKRFPPSLGQERLWFLEQLEGDSALYNMVAVLRIRGPLQVSVLQRCLDEILRRHDVLRTALVLDEGRLWQVIAPAVELRLVLDDLTGLAAARQSARLRELSGHEQRGAFDLSRPPLLRGRLLRLGEEDYIFVLTVHHSISDGWSLGVFFKELAALYPALALGAPSPLVELPIQYADYAVWQRQQLSGAKLARLLGYWQSRLAGAPALLELPTDHPRPPVQSGRGRSHRRVLEAALAASLKTLSQSSGATLFMTLLAAFAVLLYRLSGQSDVVIGTPVANRGRAELEPLIGFFVNTLALRIDLSGNPGFQTLLGRVRGDVLEAYVQQELSFEKLVDELDLARDLSQNPLFQVMFALQSAPGGAIPVGEKISLILEEREQLTAKFDLSLDVWEEEGGLTTAWTYSSDLFEAATIERWAEHFQTLLEAIITEPERPIGELPLLSQQEQVTVAGNAGSAEPQTCVHSLFETQAQLSPESLAVLAGGQGLSYRTLNARANHLARRLLAVGVGPEVVVGICMEPSVERVLGILGTLKAGGACLLLDPRHPRQQLEHRIRDGGIAILLIRQESLAELPAAPALVVDAGQSLEDETPSIPVGPDNLACVIDPSSAWPPGVMISHRALVNFATSARIEYGIRTSDRVLQFTSSNSSPAPILCWLVSGATLVLHTEATPSSVPALLQSCRDLQITVLDLPTAYWHRLAQELGPSDRALPDGLRLLIIGGEQAQPQSLRRWHRSVRPPLLNTYGTRETTGVVICCELSMPDPWGHSVPIGRPLGHARVQVLDRRLQPSPLGVSGELHIASPSLARGYLHNPALTAECFIPDPFGCEAGGRLYRTGDQVRCRSDGQLEFLGRLDYRITVKGFRIEPGEVEAVLSAHPEVRETVVVAHAADAGGHRLTAYLVPRRPGSVGGGELGSFLKSRLPQYLIPEDFVLLESLPLSGSGKVDRRALPAPASPHDAHALPRTPTEQTLAEIWAQVLGLERVCIHDNFFELGGDSTLSVRVAARATQAGLKLSSRQVFQHQSIAELAAVLATEAGASRPAGSEPLTGPVPLTSIQHRFFERTLAEPWHCNHAALLEVAPGLGREQLRQGVEHLLVHHDALRLRFVKDSGGWRQQVIAREEADVFSHVDLSNYPPEEQSALIETRAAELQCSLDLSHGPLMRAAWFELGPNRSGRILLIIHRLAADGFSWRIVLADLARAWQQLAQGRSVVLPPRTTSFKRWAEHLQDRAQSEALAAELDHWLALGRTPLQPLPMDYPEGQAANTVASAKQVARSLSEDDTSILLQEIPQTYHAQIDELLLTALALAHARWSGRAELLVDRESDGRGDPGAHLDLSRTVGGLTSLFPVLLRTPDTGGPGTALKAIKEQLRSLPGYGYGLLRCRNPELQALPQAELSFNWSFEGSPPGLDPAPESVGPLRSPREIRTHLVELEARVLENRLRLEWTYSENIHRRTTIETLSEAFMDALGALLAHRQSRAADSYTASDFPEAGIDGATLAKLARQLGKR